MATVTVRGSASVAAKPDAATVALTIAADADSPEAAYRAVAERSHELERVYEELAIAPEQRTTAGVSLQPVYDYVENRQELRGYRASARTSVRVSDSALVARLLEQAVSRAGAQIEGPWWTVDLENPARLEACRRAAATAKTRAEAYAESLGLQLGALQSAVEAGAVAPGPQPRVASFAAVEEVPISGGEQIVTAAVELTYELSG
jgi:uncharacterized protein YggE